jgi:glycosyltransferase involved in cell wall biosynthesis
VWEFNTFPVESFKTRMTNWEMDEKLSQFRKFARYCDLAVCVSHHLADFVQKELNIEHTLVVPNGSDPALFDPDKYKSVNVENINPERLNILWMGSADLFWNDFEQLMSAIEILNTLGYGKRIDFHIIGTNALDVPKIPENVFFHGKLNYEKLPIWLAQMDLGLIIYKTGSADYNSPLKLFDYLSSGMAVISNDQPQVREVLSKINAEDLICTYGDADEMAKIIEGLVNQPERLKLLGSRGRELVVETYNWKRSVRDTYDHILKMKNERKSLS